MRFSPPKGGRRVGEGGQLTACSRSGRRRERRGEGKGERGRVTPQHMVGLGGEGERGRHQTTEETVYLYIEGRVGGREFSPQQAVGH